MHFAFGDRMRAGSAVGIEHRIPRIAPADSFIVPGSTPVVAFGNAQTAAVATLLGLKLMPLANRCCPSLRALVSSWTQPPRLMLVLVNGPE